MILAVEPSGQVNGRNKNRNSTDIFKAAKATQVPNASGMVMGLERRPYMANGMMKYRNSSNSANTTVDSVHTKYAKTTS